jgi:hypothetical protein
VGCRRPAHQVGAVSSGFLCVQIFCVYAALGLAFHYAWMLTVFGRWGGGPPSLPSCLTWAGRLERAGRHCLLLARSRTLQALG